MDVIGGALGGAVEAHAARLAVARERAAVTVDGRRRRRRPRHPPRELGWRRRRRRRAVGARKRRVVRLERDAEVVRRGRPRAVVLGDDRRLGENLHKPRVARRRSPPHQRPRVFAPTSSRSRGAQRRSADCMSRSGHEPLARRLSRWPHVTSSSGTTSSFQPNVPPASTSYSSRQGTPAPRIWLPSGGMSLRARRRRPAEWKLPADSSDSLIAKLECGGSIWKRAKAGAASSPTTWETPAVCTVSGCFLERNGQRPQSALPSSKPSRSSPHGAARSHASGPRAPPLQAPPPESHSTQAPYPSGDSCLSTPPSHHPHPGSATQRAGVMYPAHAVVKPKAGSGGASGKKCAPLGAALTATVPARAGGDTHTTPRSAARSAGTTVSPKRQTARLESAASPTRANPAPVSVTGTPPSGGPRSISPSSADTTGGS